MVQTALAKLNDRNGSSKQAILKFIISTYSLDAKFANLHLKLALKSGVKSGALKQPKGVGATGSFKLGESTLKKKNPTTTAANRVKKAATKKEVIKMRTSAPIAATEKTKKVAKTTKATKQVVKTVQLSA
jgi:hypothetical protein